MRVIVDDASMHQQYNDGSAAPRRTSQAPAAITVMAMIILSAGCGSHYGPSGKSLWKNSIEGSGIIVEESRPAEGVKSIDLRISCQVVGGVSDTASLTISGDDNLLQHIQTEIIDGKLRIESDERLKPSSGIKVNITSPDLTGATISGSGKIMLTGIETSQFYAAISGSGTIQAAGTSENVDANISGSGSIDLLELPAVNVSASISGSGLIQVNAGQSLKAQISGSGSIRYTGEPSVSKHISGSGSVSGIR